MSETQTQGTTTQGRAGTPDAQDLAGRYSHSMIGVFGTPQRVLVRGEGTHVWDADGKEYLDLLGGIAVNALGHAHPDVVAAMTKQAGTLVHVSNFFATPTQIELAERLLELAKAPEGSGVFFTNSGTESNEAAFKIARRTGRPRILALEKSFHGRTMGALALTHKEAYRAPFEPLPGGVEFLPAGDTAALEAALAPGDVAALVLEPIQGEAGVLPLTEEYLRAARELTARHGALLILDEVQTGVGRTGEWFAHQAIGGLQPDVMTLAKGLGGGFPIGAVLTFGEHATGLLSPGQHGTTFGGNPLGAAVSLAVLGTLAEDGLLEKARTLGTQLQARILELAGRDPRITGVRGAGLLQGITLAAPIAPQVVVAALEHGFILNAANPSTLRLAPPLIITDEELGSFVEALPALLDAAERAAASTTDEKRS
ncbi:MULTISPECIES: acetylornithine transaminase [Brachybacterium]|uniref:Acetylornithine aminotransferase n=2 Tax=Brachybacterium TaxID=43668 RepID=A0A3R8QNK6_9MICO|nr:MULTISPECIES: acetylornithine transaminase [Brachybacterium]RRR18907.1 acetylornithine transaminase [Brachybacterium paraconglomeratum]GLI30793.1 acetylornithine aminotransferase [Brachybacterium conglomeratum]GLK05307.1 acetylornithine aminotransferase [Brachybacterium conglomeratum]